MAQSILKVKLSVLKMLGMPGIEIFDKKVVPFSLSL
jgi:hypothetical protein